MRRGMLVLGLLAVAVPAAGQEPTPPVHQVRRGDTLWELARACLGDPFRWPEIWRLNRGIVADPDRIYPRESLRLPACEVAQAQAPAARGQERSVFYREERSGTVGVGLGEEAAEPVELVTPGEYYRAGLLVHDREVTPVGQVAEVLSASVVPIRIEPQVQPYNRVFLRVEGTVRPGDRLHLLRREREVKPYGHVYLSTGLATVESVSGGTATLVVDQLFGQVQRGDVAVPLALFRAPLEGAAASVSGPTGRLLTFQTVHPVPGLNDLGFVDLGRQFGVKEGDELEAFIPETRESWGVRPAVRVARLRVVRSAERTAAVQVIGMDQPALTAGLPVRLVSRTP